MNSYTNDLSDIKGIVAVMGGKGGVGKSTVAGMLAVCLRRRSLNVGILDADILGPSIPSLFGLRENLKETGFGILPARTHTGISVASTALTLADRRESIVLRGPVQSERLREFISSVIWGTLDVLLIDMPPGTGDIPISVMGELPLCGAVTVTQPGRRAADIARKTLRMAQNMGVSNIALVENMAYYTCPDCECRILSAPEEATLALQADFSIPCLCRIPALKTIAGAGDEGFTELYEGDFLDAAADAVEEAVGIEQG